MALSAYNHNSAQARHRFNTTQWTMVLNARDQDSEMGRAALERLCQTYWYPLYAFARRKGRSPEDAQDLVQGFFEQFLSKGYLETVAREKGKFRTFLLACMTHFMANEWESRNRQKRGGGTTTISIDAGTAEERFKLDPADPATPPDAAFDRAWAEAVFDQVIAELRQEYELLGEKERFEALNSCLMGSGAEEGYKEVGARLGLSEGGVKTVVRRMRLRFRDILREELAQTLTEEADVDAEIRHLLLALKS
jgi:RNA polymerase sigma factor (sigma-70 family)